MDNTKSKQIPFNSTSDQSETFEKKASFGKSNRDNIMSIIIAIITSFIASIITFFRKPFVSFFHRSKGKTNSMNKANSKNNECNKERIKDILIEIIENDDEFKKYILQAFSTNNRNPNNNLKEIKKQLLNSFFCSEELRKVVGECVKEELSHTITSEFIQQQDSKCSHNNVELKEEKEIVLYAKDSRNMFLNEVTQAFQSGRSIYKLLLSENEPDRADLDLALEKDEVTYRIINNDSRLITPICEVTKSSNKPTLVNVAEKGVVKKNGLKWEVIKSIKVILK